MHWDIVITVYNLLLILRVLWQAFHVSQMKYKNLAMEGDVSILALTPIIIIILSTVVAKHVLEHERNFAGVFVVGMLHSMLIPTIIIIFVFLPKVSTPNLCKFLLHLLYFSITQCSSLSREKELVNMQHQ